MATDLLRSLLNKARERGLLNLPIPLNATSDFPVFHYVDDILIVLEGDARQLLFLKFVLHSSESAGLKVNYNKSMMVSINLA